MRNFKKILVAICVLSLLVVGCTVWALAEEEENIGTVAELSALIETAETASDKTKYEAVKAIRDYLDTYEMDTEEEGYADAMLRVNAVAVEAADIYLCMIPSEFDNNVDVDELIEVFNFADGILTMFDIPNGTAGFNAVKDTYDRALLNLSKVLIATIGDDIVKNPDNTAQNKIKLNKAMSIILYSNPYNENDDLTTIKADFSRYLTIHNEAVEKKLNALDDKNDVSAYDLPIYYEENFENGGTGYGKDKLPAGWSFTSQGSKNRVGVQKEKSGNQYYVHEYIDKDNPSASFIQRGLSGYKTENGLVFEFSIATFGEIPAQGIQIETGSLSGAFPSNAYFAINGNGDICSGDKTTVLLKGALVKGGWLDIIIVLNPEDFNYYLYVEGEYLGKYWAGMKDGSTFDHSKVAFRISGGPSTQGQFSVDNIRIYAGSNYRNEDRLANMTTDEKFLYFVNYFSNSENPVLDRKEAYDRALALVRNYCSINTETGEYTFLEEYQENEEIKAAVDAFMVFDIDTLVASAKLDNLKAYVALVARLQGVERSMDSIPSRNNIVNEITNFNKLNLNLIDQECDLYTPNADGTLTEEPNGVVDYDEYLLIYNKLFKQIDYDTNSSVFVGYIQRFQNATSLSATQRYYDYAKSYIDNDLIDMTLILTETTPGRENFKELIDAYEIYTNASKKVDQVTKINNAKRIVQCIRAIDQYRTEEQWEANSEMIVEYLNIVKDAVLVTDANGDPVYDTTYEGIDEAVRFFNRVYSYFYAKQQDIHAAYIGDILDRIAATDDYVGKIGLVALVDKYVGSNDVDITDARIAQHLKNLETSRAELVYRGEDYPKRLQQNSVYFVNFVEKMRTATDYDEQVMYYEQATVLYFSLDTEVEGTWAAIEIYDEYNVKLKRIEESSVKFLEAMAIYRACETAEEKYAALVDCYYNAQFAELSYEGVAEAMDEYQSAYDAHMAYATAVNKDLVEAGHAVGSFRVNCGITNIVAIIVKKIFGA